MSAPERIDSRDLDLDDPEDKALYDELEENSEEHPDDGVFPIRADKFVEYAQEYADETGSFSYRITNPRTFREEAIDLSQEWPFNHIDWEAAAEDLRDGWFEVEYKGATYYVRP